MKASASVDMIMIDVPSRWPQFTTHVVCEAVIDSSLSRHETTGFVRQDIVTCLHEIQVCTDVSVFGK
jgi:hypothetical protein